MISLVLKVGGNSLAQAGFTEQLASTVARLQQRQRCILVHGGGPAIDDLMDRLGIRPVYLDGQRVTDEAALHVAQMVLSGDINKQITLALLQAGLDAIGMSGIDRGLLRVEPWAQGMGRVGRIIHVRKTVLLEQCEQGVVPVISPISAGVEGHYNVNADHAAGAIAGAVGAARAVFITNVPGVNGGDETILRLTAQEAKRLIEHGIIREGMIPKVQAALHALDQGVPETLITDLGGLSAGSGTKFVV